MSDYNIDNYHEDHCDPPPPRTRVGSAEHENWLELMQEEVDTNIEDQHKADKDYSAALDVHLKKITDALEGLEADLKRDIKHAQHAEYCRCEFLHECKIVDEWTDEVVDFAEDALFMDWSAKIDNLKQAADLLNRARFLVETAMEDY